MQHTPAESDECEITHNHFFLCKPEHLWLLRSYQGSAIMSAINVTLHDVLLWKTTEVIAKILSS